MIEQDTVRLLRECDAGVKMGVSSISEVLGAVQSSELRMLLARSRREHEALGGEIQSLIDRFGDGGRAPSPVAQGMSWLKTNMRLAVDGSDQTVADLMTDGCNMGVKSLSRYLNEYKAADERSKSIARRLIRAEEQLSADMRGFL